VWVIRKFQPDVIVARFPTTGEGGHGHHTASAILAGEAFAAAGDATKFPEQLKYVRPWQRSDCSGIASDRISRRSSGRSARRHDVRLDLGSFNSLLGRSYGEIAATAAASTSRKASASRSAVERS